MPPTSSPRVAYKADLLRRYWDYQRERFPAWQDYFERPEAPDQRPPVFLRGQAWLNVIFNPTAHLPEMLQLLTLLPARERHKWFRSMNSSQALAQSVLGNLTVYDALGYLAEITDDDGEPLFSDAQVMPDNFTLEYRVSTLGEPRATSLDAFVSGDYQVAVECKFTESQVGTCSRPKLKPTAANYERDHCDGTYTVQRARKERCSLTEVGVRYWQYVPELFNWRSDRDYAPCPLKHNYQLVRNVLAAGVRPDGSASIGHGHALLLYDERNPAFQPGGKGYTAYAETQSALKAPAMLRKCSWQRITRHLRDRAVLPWLTDELVLKYGL
jgi:hypothetical protein